MEGNREKVKGRDGVEVCLREKKRMREESEGKRKTEREKERKRDAIANNSEDASRKTN